MFIYLLNMSILIHDSYSLKDKRKITKSILDYARNQLKISSAELACQDILNQTNLGFVTISSNKDIARNLLEKLIKEIECKYDITVVEYYIEER